ncbi:MAG: GNAT family N-acetyltransferase [Aristaeellaceae bacterium]
MSQLAFLRTDLSGEDLQLLIRWMSNEHVYRFLNEHQQIAAQLKQIYDARLPVFTPLFNRNGRFYMICAGGGQAIGFLRLQYAADNAAELVIAIGEEAMWGRGYGRAALAEALRVAFFELRREKIIAHIYHENTRSRQMFMNRGFVPCRTDERLGEYQLTCSEYLRARCSPQPMIG